MQLSGLEHSCGVAPGGLATIRVAPVSGIVNVYRNPSDGSVTSVVLAPGCSFVRYEFAEASATLREELSRDGGAELVSHSLHFAAEASDASRRAVAQLAVAGVVAIVETVSGRTLLVGYSDKFGIARPLVLVSALQVSGAKKSDRPLLEVTLRSADTSPSLPFTGQIP